MYITGILKFVAVLAGILLFLMVADCAAGIPGHRRKEHGSSGGPPLGSGPLLASKSSSSSSAATSTATSGSRSHSSRYRFLSRCASDGKLRKSEAGYLRILQDGEIDAKAFSNDPFAEVWLSSVSTDGIVKIQSVETKKYLCFSPKGKLITKKKGHSPYCNFFHHSEANYDQFYSAYNRTKDLSESQRFPLTLGSHKGVDKSGWMVGFNARGEPLNGRQQKAAKCYDFLRFKQEEERPLTLPDLGLTSSDFQRLFNSIKSRKESESPDKSEKNKKNKKNNVDESKEKGKKRTKNVTKKHENEKKVLGELSRTYSDSDPRYLEDPRILHSKKADRRSSQQQISFDSYLEETEKILQDPSILLSKVEKRSPNQHSAFILRDEGGWQEVLVDSIVDDDKVLDDDVDDASLQEVQK